MQEKSSSRALPIILLVVGLILGALLGFVGCRMWGGASGGLVQSTDGYLAEDQLDKTVAVFTYDGKDVKVTARQALEEMGNLDNQKTPDGTYRTPSAELIVSYARNYVLAQEASKRGIKVSDDEVSEYLEKNVGMDDISAMARQYNMTEDQAKKVIKESAAIAKMRDQIVGTDSNPTAPQPPAAPAQGADQDAVTADYAKYIVGLLGDEWDANKGSWAREDGQFYAALKNESFNAEGATYQAAQIAYYIANNQYGEKVSKLNEGWTKFIDSTLSKSNIRISSLSN